MGTTIVEQTKSNSLGLKSVYRSGFIRFGVDGRGKPLQGTLLIDDSEEEKEGIKPMDRFLEKQNAESIRQTMQTQEDIFKQQVRELHRVYNVQKMMMDQLKHRSQYRTTNNNDQTIGSSSERAGSFSASSLENVARLATKTTLDHIEESEIELTLSIGMSSSSTTNKDMDYSSTMSFRSSSDNCNNQSNNNNNNNNSNNQENSGPNTPMSSSSTTSLDLDRKRPHWLFQGLNINRTS